MSSSRDLEASDQETAPTEGSGGLRPAPLRINEPEKTSS